MPSVHRDDVPSKQQRKSRRSVRCKEDEIVAVLEDIVNVPVSAKKMKPKSKQHKTDIKKTGNTVEPEDERKHKLIKAEKSNGCTKGDENEKEYLKITFNSQSAKLIHSGDCVTIAGPNDQKYFAKIVSFYKNHFSDQLNASIRWFFSANEIPKKLLPDDTHAREIFLSASKRSESIEVESILDSCRVKWIDPKFTEINIGESEYFYRKSFSGKKIRDVVSPLDEKTETSKAEQRNGILSPKRLRQTPSKYAESREETRSKSISKAVKPFSSAPALKKQSSLRQQNSPLRSPESQIEDKILTSPIAASGYGRLEASAVALDILNSNESDDDDSMSTSSKSSSKTSKTSTNKRQNEKKPVGSTTKKKLKEKSEGKPKSKENGPNKKIVGSDTLVLRIPKAKIQNKAVAKLKIDFSEPVLRSSPRRKSVNIVTLADEDSDFESDESSSYSDDSYEEKPSPRKSARRLSNAASSKSVKRVRIAENKTTVTPIRIKMPRDKLPFIPARPTPKRSAKGNLEKCREKLHVSAIPECLPCREGEFQEIFTFVEGKIRSGGGGCMYVSGVPGTGKTATVREVMNALRQSVDEGDLSEFTYVDINGMRLTEPRQAYVQLLLQLTGQKATADHASNLLTKLFSQRRKTSTVVLADELDLLWTKKQDVLYHLFDWPTHRHARLIVVAIANTMDLPERILMNRVASRLGLTRLTFRPYTFKQLQEIVHSRLEGLHTFESDAIQLAARKVAAVSGDARRCLDICRRATEITEREGAKMVTIEHVHAALQEMFATPMIQAIRSCSKQEQLFLHAIVAEFRRSGMEEATLGRVIEQHTAISQLEGAAPVTVSTVVQISHRLASNRLILLEGGQRDLFSRIRLNVSVDDVLFSLKQ